MCHFSKLLQIFGTLVYVEISLSPIFLFDILNPTKVIEKSKLPSLAVCLAKFKLSVSRKRRKNMGQNDSFSLGTIILCSLGNVYF